MIRYKYIAFLFIVGYEQKRVSIVGKAVPGVGVL